MSTFPGGLDIRPYQMMCIVCKLGAGVKPEGKLGELLDAMRKNPDMPVTLRANVDSVYRFQNPGRADDTPEGELFNEKRDLDILQLLGLVPGSTRPALELFERLLKDIPTARSVCGRADAESATWKGCPAAASGNYEKGLAKGITNIFPSRDKREQASAKTESVEAMYEADTLLIRPHHLLCMACFHQGRTEMKPIAADNLFEAIDIIQKNPGIPVKLVRGCCMICLSCARYNPKTKLCSGGLGMNLRDQKKDLDTLRLLGLKYGDVLPGRRLYELVFERIPSTKLVCSWIDGEARGREWSICSGAEGSERYLKAREANLGIN